MKSYLKFLAISVLLWSQLSLADCPTTQLFELSHYDQDIDHWISYNNEDANKPLMTENTHQHHYEYMLRQHFAPWDKRFIDGLISDENIYDTEAHIVEKFKSPDQTPKQINYFSNFRPVTDAWVKSIADNMDLDTLKTLTYTTDNLAIAVTNAPLRVMPTNEPTFHHYNFAGQGYPFDTLQTSVIWMSTPVYILHYSKDRAWVLIRSASEIGWLPATAVAHASSAFISTWQNAKTFVSPANEKIALHDINQRFLIQAHMGSILPLINTNNSDADIAIPIIDSNGEAQLKQVSVNKKQIIVLPLMPTPANFTALIKKRIGKPYGWGGYYFYHDCSSELKDLFAMFGIWLPRNSGDQTKVGYAIDVDNEIKTAQDPDQRIDYLNKNGHPFMTIVYINGHVMLYLGSWLNPHTHQNALLTYQSAWGLRGRMCDTRSVIGQTALLPLQHYYPEDITLLSQAEKEKFIIVLLDKDNY